MVNTLQRKKSNAGLLSAFVVTLLCLQAGAAVLPTLYWKGDCAGSITNPANYCTDAKLTTRCTELPNGNEVWIQRDNMTMSIDDGMREYLPLIGGIDTRKSKDFSLIVTNKTDLTLPFWVGDPTGYGSWRTSHIVKFGAGTLKMGATSGDDVRVGFDVHEGAVRHYDPRKAKELFTIGDLILAAGTTFYCMTNATTSGTTEIARLSGAGTLTHDSSNGAQYTLKIGGSAQEYEPTVFSGKLSGSWSIVNLEGYTYFTGTDNDFSSVLRGYSTARSDWTNGVAVGFTSWPTGGGVSSLGTSSGIDNRSGPLRLRYLGTEPVEAGRQLTVWNTMLGPTTIDGGLSGGLTWKGSFAFTAAADAALRQQRVAFAGSNLVSECVFEGDLETKSVSGTNFSFHVTKDGVGAWRFDGTARTWAGALTVRDGTLKYETVEESGRSCSLGTASLLYDDVCESTSDLTPVPWAWRLGDAADSATTGTLHYVGTEDRLLESRATALAGAGRFRFEPNSLFKYAAGIFGLGSGEKSVAFDNGEGATNVVSDVSDGSDGATVSVIKEGHGVYELTGDLGFTGDVIVKAGELRIRDINDKPYRWFRYTFKENRCSSTNAAYSALSVATGNNYAGRVSRAINLDEIGLYDSAGRRLTSWSKVGEVVTNGLHFTLQSNQVALKDPALVRMVDTNRDDFRQLFDNNHVGGGTCWICWSDRNLYPQFDKPESWIVVYQRLDDAAAEAVSYDLCYVGHSGSDGYKGGPTAYAIEGSVDGVHFEEVASTNNVVYSPASDSSYGWLSNDGTDAGWTTALPENVAHPKLPLDATRQVRKFARPAPRSVGVASGAKLVFDGEPLTTAGVTLGTDGFGTVSGIKLAAEGSVNLVCDLSDRPKKVFFPVDFSQFGDSDNVLGYAVTVNGGTLPRAYAASVAPNGVTLTRKGFVLVVR